MPIRIVVSVVVLVILGLFGWLMFLNPEAMTALRQWAGDDGAPRTASQGGVFTEEGEVYSIRAEFPERTLLASAEADAQARLVMERGIGEAIAEFKQLADPARMSADEFAWASERNYALNITYQEHASAGTVSYVYLIYSDTGGAHPNAFFRTFTFTEQGEELDLGDLFVEGTLYLEAISEKTYASVVAQLSERSGTPSEDMVDIVRIGTSPTPETLQSFYLEEGALHIIIPPYQAASYAAGYFDVAIPLAELQDILK